MMSNRHIYLSSKASCNLRKPVKTIIGVIISFILFLLVCRGLNIMYVVYDPWFRILFHSYYSENNIDTIFLGASHVFCDIDPSALDELNGKNNFNLSTYNQRWDVTYYLLKDALTRYNVREVYLECYYAGLTKRKEWNEEEKKFNEIDMIDSEVNYSRKWLISDNMRPSLSKLMIITSTMDSDHTMEALFPYTRYRENLFDWDQIQKNIQEKKSDDYRNYRYVQMYDDSVNKFVIEYRDKGFYFSEGKTLVGENRLYEREQNLAFGEESVYYLRKTIELCLDNNIQVKLFVSPIYDGKLMAFEGYDEYLSCLSSLANEYGVELYDFNIIKKEYLDINKDKFFMDFSHLNGAGAKLFTLSLYDVLKSNMEENKDKFYSTYKEKQEETDPTIYGMTYEYLYDSNENDLDIRPSIISVDYCILSNRDDMQYRVLKRVDEDGDGVVEGDSELIQDYGINKEFVLPTEECGIFYVYSIYEGKNIEMEIKYGYDE